MHDRPLTDTREMRDTVNDWRAWALCDRKAPANFLGFAADVLAMCDEMDDLRKLVGDALTDYDRRRATRRGRALLWLLARVA